MGVFAFRARIAGELGIEYPTHTVAIEGDDDARAVAVTLNADRRQLTTEQRRMIVPELRAQGHSLRAIAGAVGVDPATVHRDLAGSTVAGATVEPVVVVGVNGKHYAPTRPTPPPAPTIDEPDDDDLFAEADESEPEAAEPTRSFVEPEPPTPAAAPPRTSLQMQLP